MSLVRDAWDWYAANSDKVNPIVAGLGGRDSQIPPPPPWGPIYQA